MNRVIAFFKKSAFFKLWCLPVWLLLGVSKALIFLLSFRRLERLMGKAHGVSPVLPLLTTSQRKRASQIGHVVRMTARYTPWNSNCYPQAITAALLLRLYKLPYLLCFGLKRSEDSRRYLAHAWVAAGPVNVTGGFSFNAYTVVACYLEPGLSTAESS
ncbi:hypothetical protein HVA01_33760 [Halovibrio variabilis]|uniref:Microcin J25-processing protein McjB C-terminal domain-containing protein n=1 Tax=Halovibrio variabilis TaxID=31910 RepID=A0A511UT14_9GAMM|nr:hypothetical protein HVA01_33760 [Halovibrio variabilis]